jgi:hypothetical protein
MLTVYSTDTIIWSVEWIHEDKTRDVFDVRDIEILQDVYDEIQNMIFRCKKLDHIISSNCRAELERRKTQGLGSSKRAKLMDCKQIQSRSRSQRDGHVSISLKQVDNDVSKPTIATEHVEEKGDPTIARRGEAVLEEGKDTDPVTKEDSDASEISSVVSDTSDELSSDHGGAPEELPFKRKASSNLSDNDYQEQAPIRLNPSVPLPYFYLVKPLTSSKKTVLVPLNPTQSVAKNLRHRTVLEFPTIYTMQEAPDNLPPDFILENHYLEQIKNEEAEMKQLVTEMETAEANAAEFNEEQDTDMQEQLFKALSADATGRPNSAPMGTTMTRQLARGISPTSFSRQRQKQDQTPKISQISSSNQRDVPNHINGPNRPRGRGGHDRHNSRGNYRGRGLHNHNSDRGKWARRNYIDRDNPSQLPHIVGGDGGNPNGVPQQSSPRYRADQSQRSQVESDTRGLNTQRRGISHGRDRRGGGHPRSRNFQLPRPNGIKHGERGRGQS